MNEKEIDYNLLEVEKGNKRYGIYLKNHIQDQHNRIVRLSKENDDLINNNNYWKRKCSELNNIINEAINYIDDNTYYKDHKGHININDLYIILQKGSDTNVKD